MSVVSNSVNVQTRTFRLREFANRCNCPVGQPCSLFFTCRMCTCVLETFPFGRCMRTPFIISNANVRFRRNGRVLVTSPSEYVQYTVINKPRRNEIRIRTFRFSVKNKNKRRAFIQMSPNGKLMTSKIFFNSKGKVTKIKPVKH